MKEHHHHHVTATSFADPADVAAYKKCKAQGMSDSEAFKFGDNGIGCWGDDTTTDEPCCALPPEHMEARWGSVKAAKHKKVLVTINGVEVECVLKDRLPREVHKIDLNPGACAKFGLTPPVKIKAAWRWVDKP